MNTGVKDRELSKWERLFFRLISSVLIVSLFNLLYIDKDWTVISYVGEISTLFWILEVLDTFFILTFAYVLLSKARFYNNDALVFCISSIFLGLLMLIESKDIYLTVITVFFVLFAVGAVLKRFPYSLRNIDFNDKTQKLILIILGAATFLYVGALVVLRFFLFKTPNFDFGIFSQMFYYMKETGMPMTTTERNYFLSHFAIHFSPVFYLILPVYIIFPHPVTLIVVQLLIVLSGAIPVYLLCKNKKYSALITVGIVAVFLLYPTMRSGLFYDFHENKFLPPLLLWLFYFMENKKLPVVKRNIGIAVFALLSLMVKEDAAIYVACMGLFFIASEKDKKEKFTGIFIAAGAVFYFLIVYFLLNKFGAGSAINSIGRYENLLASDEEGLADMVMNILKNPAYTIKQLLTKEKLEFVLWTMVPVMFVPLMLKKVYAYILLIPYLVMNLLTNYGYQYDITFQYTYGSCTLLLCMVILWFEGADTVKKRICVVFMVIASLLTSANAISSRNAYLENTDENLSYCDEIFEMLYTIPDDKSVSADTWFVPALSQRKEVYEYSDKLKVQTDFIVLDMRSENVREKNKEIADKKIEEGYCIFGEIEKKILILEKK